MKKTIVVAGILATLVSTTAVADTSSMNGAVTGMGILENDYVRAGVNGISGTFGSGGNTSPGLLFDSTGTGTFNTAYDYLTPGSPFDGFSVKVDGTNYSNNNGRSNNIAGDGNGLTDGTNSLSWTGGVAGVFDITNTYSLGATSPYIDITSQITMGVAATDLYFSRHIDPDARAAAGDSSSTDNVLGYGVIPDSNVAFSEALSSRYALGLYSTDSNVDAGISSWSQEADAYTENEFDPTSNTNTGDNTIGLTWHWTSVSIGDILTASYAYIFGPSAFAAAEDAITGGAGGGADVSSWGTLTDVGSATDAATSASAPTLVSTSSPITSYGSWSAWTTNTSLPILTQTQTTHDASETTTVQTIDRETTTVVTTPEIRSRAYTTTVTDTYSDSSTVIRTTGTGTDYETQNTVVTTITNPGSFVGRIDQVASAQDVTSSALRSLTFEGVQAIGMSSTMNNGMTGNTSGVQAGGSQITDNGISITLGGARINTTLEGNGDTITADTTVIGVSVGRDIDQGTVIVGVRHATTDYAFYRTIGNFANTGATSGTDTAISLRFEGNSTVKPVLGYTRGQETIDGYTETGSIQSARTVAESSNIYGYATIGGSVDIGLVNVAALHHTNGINDLTLGIQRDTGNITFNVTAQRSMTDLGDTNTLKAGVIWKF